MVENFTRYRVKKRKLSRKTHARCKHEKPSIIRIKKKQNSIAPEHMSEKCQYIQQVNVF